MAPQPLANGVKHGGDEREEDVRVEHGTGVVRIVVVVDRRLVDVAVGIPPERDSGDDHDRQQEAIAKPDGEHGDDPECQITEADLGLEAAVAALEANFPGNGRPSKRWKPAPTMPATPIVTTIHQISATRA